MAKFRKKPLVIEATQWHPGRQVEGVVVPVPGDDGPYVQTLEGPLRVSPGDWIITGVKGERYPCKPDVFEATYDPAMGEKETDGYTYGAARPELDLHGCPASLHNAVTVELEESDRQLVLLSLAVLSVQSPGFDDALNRIAIRIDNMKSGRAVMYDEFRKLRSQTRSVFE
jgi:hypothetical protein